MTSVNSVTHNTAHVSTLFVLSGRPNTYYAIYEDKK